MTRNQNVLALPALLEFSPGVLGGADSLLYALKIVDENPAYSAAREAIRTRWFEASAGGYKDPEQRQNQQAKRAGNVISGMRAAGLVEGRSTLALTELALELLEYEDQPEEMCRSFVRHLLREGHGMDLLDVARDIMRSEGEVSKQSVDQGLRDRGFTVPNNSGNSSRLRGWLETAGVVNDAWEIDEARLADVVGVDSAQVSEWLLLSELQRRVLEVLLVRHEGNKTPIASPDLAQLLDDQGIVFNRAQLNRDVYAPLVATGWLSQTGTTEGRGSRGGVLQVTEKLLGVDLDFIKSLHLGSVPAELRALLATPFSEIQQNLLSLDTGVKGVALELLSLRLASEIGLRPVDLRLRASQTGGAEVDLVAEGSHLHFSRWLFQCKNQTSPVGLPVLAKEVGMATLLRAQVVVIVTTGTFARSVLDYARQAAETTAIQIILIDREVLAKYQSSGRVALRSYLNSVAKKTMVLKRPQLDEVPVEER